MARDNLETQVECESDVERRYRVRDFWKGHREFEAFRERHAKEIEKLVSLLAGEGLIEREQLVGAYYESEPGDGEQLVPD